MRRGAATVGCALFALVLPACDESQVWHDLHISDERMLNPQYNRAYSGDNFFGDDNAMRPTPPGAVARGEDEPAFKIGDRYVDRIAVPVTPALMQLGKARFDVACAACHGVLADGHSVVASKMELRKPPDLHEARFTDLPPGRLYEIVRDGYGLMPSYTLQLPTPEDRWAVVAYLRALQVSQSMHLSELSPAERARFQEEVP